MTVPFLAHLADVSVRVLPIALIAVVLLRFSVKTTAILHATWTLVLCSMLILLLAGPVLPPLAIRMLPNSEATERASPRFVQQVTEAQALSTGAKVVAVDSISGPTPVSRGGQATSWPLLLLLAYSLPALFSLCRLLKGCLALGNILRSAHALGGKDADRISAAFPKAAQLRIVEAHSLLVPVTAGCVRPAIILPADWRNWSEAKLAAVLAHEVAHIERRDPLIAMLAVLNRCVFWFHPLAWWLENKLALLAEHACDEAGIQSSRTSAEYAGFLVEIAAALGTDGRRVPSRALAMIAPSSLRQRIDAILTYRSPSPVRLSGRAWAVAALLCIPVVYAAGALSVKQQSEMLPPDGIVAAVPPAPSGFTQKPAPLEVPKPAATASPAQLPSVHQSALSETAAPPEYIVEIPVAVVSPLNQFVTGLGPENFRVFHGTVERPVVKFLAVEAPVSFGIVVTGSATLPGSTEEMRRAVEAFFRATGANAQFFVVSTHPQPRLALPFQTHTNLNDVQRVLSGLRAETSGRWPEALALAVRQMREASNPRRVIVIIAPFVSGEPVAGSEALRQARENNVAVYFVSQAQDQLLPKLAVEIRNQYVLSYSQTAVEAADTTQDVRVEVIPPIGLPQLRAVRLPTLVGAR